MFAGVNRCRRRLLLTWLLNRSQTDPSPPVQRSTSSARCCCHHAGYRIQDPKHCDLADLLHASHLRNLHGRLLRRGFLLVVVAKSTNHDVAAKHGEEQQRGTQQRRAQPADQMITLSVGQPVQLTMCRRPPGSKLLARARSGPLRQLVAVVYDRARERLCAPVAVRPAVRT